MLGVSGSEGLCVGAVPGARTSTATAVQLPRGTSQVSVGSPVPAWQQCRGWADCRDLPTHPWGLTPQSTRSPGAGGWFDAGSRHPQFVSLSG